MSGGEQKQDLVRNLTGGLARFLKPEIGIACLVLMTGVAGLSVALAEDLSRQQLYANFTAAYGAGDLEEARDWGIRLIDAKAAEVGEDSPELIVSLINLAGVDLELMNWSASETVANRALAILDAQPDDHFAHRIELVKILANAQLGLRDVDKASDTLYAALAINNRQRPVDQRHVAEIYAMLVEVARREGDVRGGDQACSRSLKAWTKIYAKDSVELVTYIEDAADWYRVSSQFGRERKMHRRTIDILEQHYGPADARLASPLHKIAASYTIDRKRPKKAREALERAAGLDFPDSAEAALMQATVQVNLGDHDIVFGSLADGADAYRRAWRMLASHGEFGAGYATQYFSDARRLYFHQPSKPANTGKGADYFTEGYVLMEFTVSADGTLTDLDIVASRPVEMKEALFFKALKKARYRPRLVDGEPVETSNVQLRSTYSYTNR